MILMFFLALTATKTKGITSVFFSYLPEKGATIYLMGTFKKINITTSNEYMYEPDSDVTRHESDVVIIQQLVFCLFVCFSPICSQSQQFKFQEYSLWENCKWGGKEVMRELVVWVTGRDFHPQHKQQRGVLGPGTEQRLTVSVQQQRRKKLPWVRRAYFNYQTEESTVWCIVQRLWQPDIVSAAVNFITHTGNKKLYYFEPL